MNNSWSNRSKAFGTALLRGIVCVLVFFLFLLTVLSFTLRQTISERESYRRVAQEPALSKKLMQYAWDELEAECLFYGLPVTIIDEAISEKDAADFSLEFIDAVYDTVFISGKLDAPTVDPTLFRAPIAAHLAEEDVEEAVIDDLAAEFASVTTAVWQMGLKQSLLSPLHRVVTNVWVRRFLNGGPVLAGITALLVGIGLLLGRRRIRRQTFVMTGTMTVSGMLLFIPLWLLHRYGLPERLVLGDSPMRTFVVQWMNAAIAQMSRTTMWVLIGTAALTLSTAIWLVWPQRESAVDQPAKETEGAEDTAPADEAHPSSAETEPSASAEQE